MSNGKVCCVCGSADVLTYQRKGITYQMKFCNEHYLEHERRKKQRQRDQQREATPYHRRGWVKVREPHLDPPVTHYRALVDGYNGIVTLYRYHRQKTFNYRTCKRLKRNDIVQFYLAAGYRVVEDDGRRTLLERQWLEVRR